MKVLSDSKYLCESFQIAVDDAISRQVMRLLSAHDDHQQIFLLR